MADACSRCADELPDHAAGLLRRVLLIGQVLNAREKFGPMMWAPIVSNVVSIAERLLSGSGSHPLTRHDGPVWLLGVSRPWYRGPDHRPAALPEEGQLHHRPRRLKGRPVAPSCRKVDGRLRRTDHAGPGSGTNLAARPSPQEPPRWSVVRERYQQAYLIWICRTHCSRSPGHRHAADGEQVPLSAILAVWRPRRTAHCAWPALSSCRPASGWPCWPTRSPG